MEDRFPLNTSDVIDTQNTIVMILYDYFYPFVIIDGTCNLQDKINTSLYNNINPNVAELEDMNETWKKSTVLSFGAKIKYIMNGFISWHLWTKATIDKMCVKKYLKIKYNTHARRFQKTTFFDNLWVEFGKLNIKRLYKLNTQQTFVSHSITKNDILKLIKCIINERVVESKKESINHDKSVAKNHSNVNEELGLTKYYARNDDFNHFCNSKSKFRDPYFWHRVCEHFTLENTYKKTTNKYEIHQVLKPVDKSSIIRLENGKTMKKESRFSYIRPVDGVTRLKMCNCSNITGLEQTVHRKSQVIVEIPNGCMIVFTGNTCHAGVSSIERSNGGYPSFLRIFSYIVEDDYTSDDENITKIPQSQLFRLTCSICMSMDKEGIHYPNEVVKYNKSKFEIEIIKDY